jgi:hypothetical protein
MSPMPPVRPATPWKPPLWLLALDLVGMLLLAGGLILQFAPDSGLAAALPPTLRLPLLAIGGTCFMVGWVGLLLSILEHRRQR